ncbi:acyl-CoA dehydrogenase family protein [Chloroflexota bacterium]
MDFDFNEEQKLFQAAVRDFATKEIEPVVEQAEKDETCPRFIFTELGKLGFLCPAYPLEYGGGELGKIGECIMAEEISRVCSGINTSVAVQAGLSTSIIMNHGTEEQKQKFLIPACKGERIACFGLTEADAGSDVAAIKTTARRDGDHYIVNGSKIYMTNGEICDFVTLGVKTDPSLGSKGISILILERDTPGFTRNKMHKVGSHSSATAELAFEDCRVSAANLIGEEGRGIKYIFECLDGARIVHSAGSVGLAQASYEAALEYAKTRTQFGQPIGKFQAIAFKLARMATEIESLRWLLYHAAWLFDKGLPMGKEAAMTKLHSSDVAIRVAEESMRIHAGAAYLAESKVQRLFRDSILRHTTEGTTEIQQIVISRLLGL